MFRIVRKSSWWQNRPRSSHYGDSVVQTRPILRPPETGKRVSSRIGARVGARKEKEEGPAGMRLRRFCGSGTEADDQGAQGDLWNFGTLGLRRAKLPQRTQLGQWGDHSLPKAEGEESTWGPCLSGSCNCNQLISVRAAYCPFELRLEMVTGAPETRGVLADQGGKGRRGGRWRNKALNSGNAGKMQR